MLSISLLIGMVIGIINYYRISEILQAAEIAPSKLISHAVLAILSVGAPIWFSWMSTKQIGQRFKFAEDYAFKAAVASAYEGYKRESSLVDPELLKRLLNSALDRLEENPLRLAEQSNHGSPIHALSESPGVRGVVEKVIEKIPSFAGSKPNTQ